MNAWRARPRCGSSGIRSRSRAAYPEVAATVADFVSRRRVHKAPPTVPIGGRLGRSAIVLNRCHGSCTPRQFKKMAYNVVDPPMKRRFFAGPPKVTLETWCGTNIRPSNSPRELMQWTRRPHCSRCCHTRQRAYPKLTMVDRNHFLPVARSRQSGPQCSSAQLWSSHATPRTRSGCPAGHPFQSMSLN